MYAELLDELGDEPVVQLKLRVDEGSEAEVRQVIEAHGAQVVGSIEGERGITLYVQSHD